MKIWKSYPRKKSQQPKHRIHNRNSSYTILMNHKIRKTEIRSGYKYLLCIYNTNKYDRNRSQIKFFQPPLYLRNLPTGEYLPRIYVRTYTFCGNYLYVRVSYYKLYNEYIGVGEELSHQGRNFVLFFSAKGMRKYTINCTSYFSYM